jgi:hypothetical protein
VRRTLLAPLLLIAAWAAPTLAGPEEQAPGCKHWAVLLPEDAGQMRVYDGIRKGLELAQLERVCLKDLADTEQAFRAFVKEHAALPQPRPLVFMIGRRALDRMLAAGFEGPGVCVSAEWTAYGEPLRPEPALPPAVARVRARMPVESLGAVLRAALGAQRVRVAFEGAEAVGSRALAGRFLRAAQLDEAQTGPDAAPQADARLRVRLGLHAPIGAVAAHAVAEPGVWSVSDDVGDWGTGAALVVGPDHERLGRTAAEAGRRLWRGEPTPVDQALDLRGFQVHVDLDACRARGVEPPLIFLAGVDGLRGELVPATNNPGC